MFNSPCKITLHVSIIIHEETESDKNGSEYFCRSDLYVCKTYDDVECNNAFAVICNTYALPCKLYSYIYKDER